MADELERRFKFISRVAKLTNDPEDLLEVINSGAKLHKELDAQEIIALDSGYKKLIRAKLKKWRIVSKIQLDSDVVALAKEYLKRLEDEITQKCNEIILTIDRYLIPSTDIGAARVFYYKLMGDYYRYLAEVKSHADRQKAISQSLQAYEAATALAQSDLLPTSQVRLDLALNFSVFLYEIMANTERAHDIATKAVKDAKAELHILDLKSYKKCTQWIRKMEENIALWTAEDEEELQPPPRPAWLDEVDFAGEYKKA